MRWQFVRTIAVVVTFGMVIVMPVTQTVVADEWFGGTEEINDVKATKAAFLWTGDNDTRTTSSRLARYINRSANSTAVNASLRQARTNDFVYDTPPSDVVTWNRIGFTPKGGDGYSVVGGYFERNLTYNRSTSYYPDHATLRDTPRFKDAHVTIMHISPSTLVHQGNTTTRYVRQSGQVHVLADYRIRNRDNYTVSDPAQNETITQWIEQNSTKSNPLGVNITSKRVGYTRLGNKVTNVTLYSYADGERIDREDSNSVGINLDGFPNHDPYLTYDGGSAVDELRVNATIGAKWLETATYRYTLQWNKTWTVQVNCTSTNNDSDGRTSRERPDGETNGTTDTTEETEIQCETKTKSKVKLLSGNFSVAYPSTTYTTVTASRDVTVYDLDDTDVYHAELPSGTDGYIVSQDQPFAGYRIGNDTVETNLGLYTQANDSWKTLNVGHKGSDRTHQLHPAAVPVELYAVPFAETEGSANRSEYKPRVLRTWGTRQQKVTLGKNVTIATQGGPETDGTYRTVRGLVVSHQRDIDAEETAVVINGIIADPSGRTYANATIPASDVQDREVKEANLTVAVTKTNYTHMRLQVTIRDNETGKRLNLSERKRNERLNPISPSINTTTIRTGEVIIRGPELTRTFEPDDGVVNITLDRYGNYRVFYSSGNWESRTVVYLSQQQHVFFSRFSSKDGILHLLMKVIVTILPLVACYYLGKIMLRVVLPAETSKRRDW
jgi:hypothetical protein